MAISAPTLTPDEALAHWHRPTLVQPVADGGLINLTYEVGQPPTEILQWVNPIFDPRIHFDIAAVIRRVAGAGMVTPRLLPTPDGELWVADDHGGCWRLMTYVPGRTVQSLESPAQAKAAGEVVGRFHAAVAGWDETRHAPMRRIHDTPRRMRELEDALASAGGHPLAAETRRVGEGVLAAWASWDGDLDQPERLCHGDLKVSNLRFDESGEQGICLIDLDTVEPMALACELGDAWRSWCNPAGEDRPDACGFDVELFTASARAWLEHGPELEESERASLVPGIERIALELSARFAADAVENCYFREDAERFPEPGTHNLVRARCQLALALDVRAKRGRLEAVLGEAVRC